MRYPHPWLLIVVLLAACGQPEAEIEFVPVGGFDQDLREFAIAELENREIDYRITEEDTLEADFARMEDIVEISTRIWETHLPRDRSFSINPHYLTAFRLALDEESIAYRSISADGLEWTVVDEPNASRAREILNRVFGMENDPIPLPAQK